MVQRLELTLTDAQRAELLALRDHASKAYLRERAAALLKVADGQSGRGVAQHGLLRRRKNDTLYDWYHRYAAEGVAGLQIKAGRGRKPAFSPSVRDDRSSA